MPAIARENDHDSGGGTIIDGISDSVFVNGKGVALIGATQSKHEPGDNHNSSHITDGSSSVFINGKNVAWVGSNTACGHQIIEGSDNVFVGSDNASSTVLEPGIILISGNKVYLHSPEGLSAQKRDEIAFNPALASNHEGADQPNQTDPEPINCSKFKDVITTVDMQLQVSRYFTLSTIKSIPVAQRGLTAGQIACNWSVLCQEVLDNVYDQFKFKFNSGFRSLEYNRSIGSKDTSDHCIGAAADISLGSQAENIQMFKYILTSGLPFSQLIFEGQWIHVASGGASPKGNARIMYTFSGRGPISAGQNGENLPSSLKP